MVEGVSENGGPLLQILDRLLDLKLFITILQVVMSDYS